MGVGNRTHETCKQKVVHRVSGRGQGGKGDQGEEGDTQSTKKTRCLKMTMKSNCDLLLN